ncbi:uncharacterized protein LOC18433688 [Amborella trichopoda]|uniref:Uncharacterized protein n=1 Tax=Amborella trichopoda TaxID=13333 RepID=W1PC33_AMBTC|nr:uncharacterized protein LOC18433688 [Amborella trichopoda]ERN05508.1 hypothetical protein AMTR_s00007p00259420 [Amborella trichopoda]|eukprot:XP_020522365.1 uncharacterized protein LOC18433688 [Amborella trichopoda]
MATSSSSSLLLREFSTKRPEFTRRRIRFCNSRQWKRRRLKRDRNFIVNCGFSPQFSNNLQSLSTIFNNLISQVPSTNSIDLIAPVLGFISGLALYTSLRKAPSNFAGEWVLITSPTPFNRFVFLRCPSISFEDGALLENVNKRLLREDRHFVRFNGDLKDDCLSSGTISAKALGDDAEVRVQSEEFMYQRMCLHAEDGGVISLDWPASLEMMKEHGLDTTFLLVPGTVEGSMDANVRAFVSKALKHGCFPIVMNPRGCAGSPLTSPRLFTAADSDDICTTIQYINRSRPWSTLTAVGWGYGANMLTKYLSELGERTPLTAAACIDNPFDLEEAVKTFPSRIALGQNLTSGLKDILRANKELFLGRTKRFDVAEGLSATSLRDFEKAISMVSYGYNTVEEFYLKSSTRESVGSLKIPVIFIQSDEGIVPLFSVPRNEIASNPFTSLLLCSSFPSSKGTYKEKSTRPWCQNFVIEWLLSVELALLKGRHPLLKDVDITINPSKGLSFVEGSASPQKIFTLNGIHDTSDLRSLSLNKGESADQVLNISKMDVLNGFAVDPSSNTFEDSDNQVNGSANIHLRSRRQTQEKSNLDSVEQQMEYYDGLSKTSSINDVSETGGVDGPEGDVERGQVLQTAEVVIRMLDVTIPGTLAEDQKKKVLNAVGQGETLMKALEEAVPPEVRGKLTSAVNEIVQAQGKTLNLTGLMKTRLFPNITSEMKSKVQDKSREKSFTFGNLSSDQSNKVSHNEGKSSQGDSESRLQEDQRNLPSTSHNDMPSSSNGNKSGEEQHSLKNPSGLESKTSSNIREDSGLCDTKSGGDGITSRVDSLDDTAVIPGDNKHAQEETVQASGNVESGLESNKDAEKPNSSQGIEKSSGGQEASEEPWKGNQNNDETGRVSADDSLLKKEPSDAQKNEEKQSITDQNKGNPMATKDEGQMSSVLSFESPTISVTQALDALTGLDDSTQVAVNSVFGVIENMIDQLEKENQDKDEKEDQKNGVLPKRQLNCEYKSGGSEDDAEVHGSSRDVDSDGSSSNNFLRNNNNPVANPRDDHLDEKGQETVSHNNNTFLKRSMVGDKGNPVISGKMTEETKNDTASCLDRQKADCMKHGLGHYRVLPENSRSVRYVYNFPLQITVNPYGNYSYKGYNTQNALLDKSYRKQLDMNSTNDLFLEYFPEEGQWKLLDQMGHTSDSVKDVPMYRNIKDNDIKDNDIKDKNQLKDSSFREADTKRYIEPAYVLLDNESIQWSADGNIETDEFSSKAIQNADTVEELMLAVKKIVLDAIKVEVARRMGLPGTETVDSTLEHELEDVANAISLTAKNDFLDFQKVKLKSNMDSRNTLACKSSACMDNFTLNGAHIVEAISSATKDATLLGKILPVGVIVGSVLVALRNFFHVITEFEYLDKSHTSCLNGEVHNVVENYLSQNSDSKFGSLSGRTKMDESKVLNNKNVMVGAVTAALGATAVVAHHQKMKNSESHEKTEMPSNAKIGKRDSEDEGGIVVDSVEEKSKHSLVSSIAEKAMSIAAPVVPTKSDGGVDQERLVAILADLGQKGGILRLIGKAALLWGGLRGAMSLTDRLIMFLRIAERPLLQRILGFVCMVLLLWSPVVVPLLPTFIQKWTRQSSAGIAEYICIIGLYIAIVILVTIWGRRIRSYENPLQQYGLELNSPSNFHDLLKGLAAGGGLVVLIHLMNATLGYSKVTSPSFLTSSPSSMLDGFRAFRSMLLLSAKGFFTAISIAAVEELLFRSWLPEEIAVDIGYHKAIVISGLVFALFQRSLFAIPGLWLLSLAMSGAKERSKGSLCLAIGIHTGLLVTNFILQTIGIFTYRPDTPIWVTGSCPWHPFGGAFGLSLSAILAIILYPRQRVPRKLIS